MSQGKGGSSSYYLFIPLFVGGAPHGTFVPRSNGPYRAQWASRLAALLNIKVRIIRRMARTYDILPSRRREGKEDFRVIVPGQHTLWRLFTFIEREVNFFLDRV